MKAKTVIILGLLGASIAVATTASASDTVVLSEAQITPWEGEPTAFMTVQSAGDSVDNTSLPPGFGTTSISASSPIAGVSDAATASLTSVIQYSADPNGSRSLSLTGAASALQLGNGTTGLLQAVYALSYQMEFFGPDPTFQAQFLASGSVSASSSGGLGIEALGVEDGFSVFNAHGSTVIQDGACFGLCENGSLSFSESGLYAVNTGEIYTVYLSTDMLGVVYGNPGGGSESLSAFVDPSVVLPDGYSVVYSPAPTGGVPESSTWAMLAIGFAGLGWAAFARKRAGMAAAL